jgi:hypothetical protein
MNIFNTWGIFIRPIGTTSSVMATWDAETNADPFAFINGKTSRGQAKSLPWFSVQGSEVHGQNNPEPGT